MVTFLENVSCCSRSSAFLKVMKITMQNIRTSFSIRYTRENRLGHDTSNDSNCNTRNRILLKYRGQHLHVLPCQPFLSLQTLSWVFCPPTKFLILALDPWVDKVSWKSQFNLIVVTIVNQNLTSTSPYRFLCESIEVFQLVVTDCIHPMFC